MKENADKKLQESQIMDQDCLRRLTEDITHLKPKFIKFLDQRVTI